MRPESNGAVRIGVVVTSISAPNEVLRSLADGCLQLGACFWVIGDLRSPSHFDLPGCRFLSIQDQLATGLKFASACPVRHYARKNIGYLLAIANGTDVLIETDDDNHPLAGFWSPRAMSVESKNLVETGWTNVYRYFTDFKIWPRGFPLDLCGALPPPIDGVPQGVLRCPIQQGLADGNPDVDAVFRMVSTLPLNFKNGPPVALSRGSWCPFNSQNTTWFPPAFPLLYLPSYCSFRATDIWRSLIAQRICWENSWSILFHPATVYQERNEHDLMQDFADEVPVYLQTRRIAEILQSLSLRPGEGAIAGNLRHCYQSLVERDLFDEREMPLLDTWLSDLRQISVS